MIPSLLSDTGLVLAAAQIVTPRFAQGKHRVITPLGWWFHTFPEKLAPW